MAACAPILAALLWAFSATTVWRLLPCPAALLRAAVIAADAPDFAATTAPPMPEGMLEWVPACPAPPGCGPDPTAAPAAAPAAPAPATTSFAASCAAVCVAGCVPAPPWWPAAAAWAAGPA